MMFPRTAATGTHADPEHRAAPALPSDCRSDSHAGSLGRIPGRVALAARTRPRAAARRVATVGARSSDRARGRRARRGAGSGRESTCSRQSGHSERLDEIQGRIGAVRAAARAVGHRGRVRRARGKVGEEVAHRRDRAGARGEMQVEHRTGGSRSPPIGCFTCASPRRRATVRWSRWSGCCGRSAPEPLYQQLEHHYDSPDLWEAALAEHRAVLEAIAAHDQSGARAAMQRHLNQAYKRFSTGWDATQ